MAATGSSNGMQEPLTTSHGRIGHHFAISVAVLALTALLMFSHLGRHALWDDEAYTALTGEGVMRTGDTSVMLGHNIFAWANGSTLRNLHDRFFPPLPAYLSAASMMVFGESAGAARLPFALCGFLSVAMLLHWLNIDRVDKWSCLIYLILLLTNVSLILFCRQCRYYAVSIFLCVAIAYVYLHHWRSTAGLFALVASLAALFATQYFCFAAIVGVGAVDSLIWRVASPRHADPAPADQRSKPTGRIFLGATLLVAFVVLHLMIWSPFGPRATVLDAGPGTIADRFQRLWWNLRDTHVNEFWNLPLLLLAPIVAWTKRDDVLLRGCCAAAVYFLIVSAVSPHGSGKIGEIRYFCALIPLACFLEARTLRTLFSTHPASAMLLAVILFGSNLFSFGPFTALGSFPIPLRSTFAAYICELIKPPNDPYRVTSDWLNRNVPAERSVLVLPEYSTYPLMFHAPQLRYAWQLSDPPAKQFQSLPDINFQGRVLPDYVVIFGEQGQAEMKLKQYTAVTTLPVFAKDAYRPELFLRCFGEPPEPDLRSQAITILRRQ